MLKTFDSIGFIGGGRAILRMIQGSAECLPASGRDPAAVMDMAPVKPLKDGEAIIAGAYRTKPTALYRKIKP